MSEEEDAPASENPEENKSPEDNGGEEDGTSVKSGKERKGRKDEAKEKEKNLKLLKEYLDILPDAKEYKAPPRTELLSKIRQRYYLQLHEDFGNVLVPKGKAQRIKRKADNLKIITTEQLQGFIQKHEELEEIKRAGRKERERKLHTILKKLEKQCHEQVIKEIIEKFATYMSKKCTNYIAPPVMTESAQRLMRGLVCNMYLALGINKRPCNVDQSLYETIGMVLCDMILKGLFMTQHYEPVIIAEEEKPKMKCFEIPGQATKKKGKKKKVYVTGRRLKIPKMPREFTQFMQLTRKKCTECKDCYDVDGAAT